MHSLLTSIGHWRPSSSIHCRQTRTKCLVRGASHDDDLRRSPWSRDESWDWIVERVTFAEDWDSQMELNFWNHLDKRRTTTKIVGKVDDRFEPVVDELGSLAGSSSFIREKRRVLPGRIRFIVVAFEESKVLSFDRISSEARSHVVDLQNWLLK